ncbi:MAG: DUF512 domain-containing protein [Clostridia bacterium]|nr:DUF512 domain-containing protein [Clostridia bacterium]
MGVVITGVTPGGPCDGLVQEGEQLLAIDGAAIVDVLDYMHWSMNKNPTLTLEGPQGRRTLKVKKPPYEELGLEFASFLMDSQRSCANHCVFCFIDQLPKGMRDTLYFKDDDARLSFLMGNYISMTNLSEQDVARMIDYRVSPINISVHTMNPALRSKMLGNRRGGESLSTLRRFAEAGLSLNCQIVLCKGLNDRQELANSLRELLALGDAVDSIAVVPAGLTGHRQGLFPLSPFTAEEAADALCCIERYQQQALARYGRRVVFASDELYLQAGWEIPDYEFYEDFPQIENGVGMIAMLKDEVAAALPFVNPPAERRRVTTVTGEGVADILRQLVDEIEKECHNKLSVTVAAIRNDFFGGSINVTGLVTGRDIVAQLKGRDLGEELILPAVMLRYDRACFLDDMTVEALSEALQIPVRIAEMSGDGLVEALTGQRLRE